MTSFSTSSVRSVCTARGSYGTAAPPVLPPRPSAAAARLHLQHLPFDSSVLGHAARSSAHSASRGAVQCRASNSSRDSDTSSDLQMVNSPLYLAVEIAELLVILMLIDAGYSGDWTRIGAITPDVEALLQKIGAFVVISHFGVGCVAAYYANSRGRPWAAPFFKGWAFGALGLKEVMVNTDASQQ